MNRIAVTKNRWSHTEWPSIIWIDGTHELICDFIVCVGPDVELVCHPDQMVRFRQNELCGVMLEAESIHTTRPGFHAPLGYPKWRDDFFVLRSGEYAKDFLARWAVDHDVSATVWELGVQPAAYPSEFVKRHVSDDSLPEIRWGLA